MQGVAHSVEAVVGLQLDDDVQNFGFGAMSRIDDRDTLLFPIDLMADQMFNLIYEFLKFKVGAGFAQCCLSL